MGSEGTRKDAALDAWGGLLSLARHLRGPDGCPWDQAQTTRSLAPFLVEESFEVLEATESGRTGPMAEELGDLAFVLALILVTAESEGLGTVPETLSRTTEKIRARHPHVFGENELTDPTDIHLAWERRKDEEEGLQADAEPRTEGETGTGSGPDRGSDRPSIRLRRPHPALPALSQSRKLQMKAAALGFDWPEIAPVFDKTREELAEVEDALKSGDAEHVREELGDLLFAVVNLARFLDVEPESALRRANEKFRDRFHRMIARMEEDGRDPRNAGLDELDTYWNRIKEEAGERPLPPSR